MDSDQENCIAIPHVWEPGQFHYIYFNNLPPHHDAIDVLWVEEAPTNMWLKLAVEYKKQGLLDSYAQILEACLNRSNTRYEKGPEHLEECRYALAQAIYELATDEIDPFQQSCLLRKADFLINGEVKGFKRRHGDDVGYCSTSLGKKSRLSSC